MRFFSFPGQCTCTLQLSKLFINFAVSLSRVAMKNHSSPREREREKGESRFSSGARAFLLAPRHYFLLALSMLSRCARFRACSGFCAAFRSANLESGRRNRVARILYFGTGIKMFSEFVNVLRSRKY